MSTAGWSQRDKVSHYARWRYAGCSRLLGPPVKQARRGPISRSERDSRISSLRKALSVLQTLSSQVKTTNLDSAGRYPKSDSRRSI